ncbi:transposase [Xanthomonas bromi]|uniref:Transposase n=1 Tax=Xanthomonas bromi TaxID=56449 RepID=A0A1C3NKA3_9XANT|nr:transposase [Xanthomonas bromi]
MLPEAFPKWRTVHAYFRIWSEVDADGVSLLERALKKSGWRGPRETGAQRMQHGSAGVAPAALQALAGQQRALANRQATLARKQIAAQARATGEALQVLRDALKSGLATQVVGQSH